jgi:uncharacterized protein YjiS (DUF1127 family)
MFVLSVLHHIRRWLRRRAAREQLRTLSDRELRDIGLSRCAVEYAIEIGKR